MTNRPGCCDRRISCKSTGLGGARERQCDDARPPRACPGSGADRRRNIRGEHHDQQAVKEEVAIACREGPNRKNSKATAAKPPGTTKLALLVAHLSAPGGTTIAELCKATGWQPHSVRGGLAGALRRQGHVIRSEKEGGQRRYRIEEPVT